MRLGFAKIRRITAKCTPVAIVARLSVLLLLIATRPLIAQQPQPVQKHAEGPNSPAPIANPARVGGTNSGDTHGGSPPVQPQTQQQQNITWSVGHPPERMRFPASSAIQFTVSAGDKEVKDVRLAQSTLQDVTTFLQLDASQLQLCTDDGKCDGEIDIPANTTRRLSLKISSTFHAPGTFTGEVALRIAGKPEVQSFKLTVYSRTACAMALGALVIALGLGLYFLLNVLLRRRLAIDDALLPAYQLRDSLTVLKRRVDDAIALTHVPLAALTGTLNQLDAQLTPEALSSRLPSVTILPWSSGTAWLDNFKAYLTPITGKTAGLVVLVNSGVQAAIAYWATFPVPVATALGLINGLSPTVSNASSAQAQLAPIVQALQAAVNPPHAAVLAPVLAAAPADIVARLFTLPPNIQTLQVRLLRNTLWVWWLVALIALASGFYSVVLQNFGFGSWSDYIKCFFWGLGFSVAGTQLDQLTQTAVTGNFGITIPKA